MALTKSSQTPRTSTPCGAGSTVYGTGLPINYGVSGVALVTNGSTGPTTGCGVYLQFSADNSNWTEPFLVGIAATGNSVVTPIPFAIAIGAGADWAYYRLAFKDNSGQAVTVQADASTTTSLT